MPERRFDLYGDAFKHHPHPTFAAMRREAPICKQAGLDGTTPIWFVTRYADVDAMLRDKRFVRDAALAHDPENLPREPELFRRIGQHMLNRDGVDHQRLRGLVSQAFTPRRVAEMRPRIQAIADGLLDPLVEKGAIELVGDFAFPLPTTVILEMFGVPFEDRDRVRVWGNALLAAPRDADDARILEAQLVEFADYVAALVEARRAHPQDDLLSGLVAAEEAGDRLSLEELLSTLVLLITAGHETTVNLIANAVLALSRHPHVRDALAADPAAMAAAGAPLARLEGEIALNALLARLPRLRVAVDEEALRYRFLPGFRALEALPVAWDVPG